MNRGALVANDTSNKRKEYGCNCDPAACVHGHYSKCDKCREYTYLGKLHFHELDRKEYCDECNELIRHAEKHGREIDIWEAKFVE